MPRIVLVASIGILVLLAACTQATPDTSPTTTSTPSVLVDQDIQGILGPLADASVSYGNLKFDPVAGPIRTDLLSVERLEPTGLVLRDRVLQEGSDGRRIYLLPGVPILQGFLVRSVRTGFGVSVRDAAYPACTPGSGAFIYTAIGAQPPAPPYGPVTPQPAYPGGATPTPVPTPATPIVEVQLSTEGLLNAGWPRLGMERLQPEYQGVTYGYTSFRYINEYGVETSIPPTALEELDVLTIVYPVDVGPFPSALLDELVSGRTATDHVSIYRFKDRLASEVIVVDQCPTHLRGDEFVFYQPR